MVRRWRLIGHFPILYNPLVTPLPPRLRCTCVTGERRGVCLQTMAKQLQSEMAQFGGKMRWVGGLAVDRTLFSEHGVEMEEDLSHAPVAAFDPLLQVPPQPPPTPLRIPPLPYVSGASRQLVDVWTRPRSQPPRMREPDAVGPNG